MRNVPSRTGRFRLVFILLLLLLITAVLLSMNLGTLAISPKELVQTIFGRGTRQQWIALFAIRLPRIIIALLVGGALAVSGIILQSVTRNDLAEPGIIGISSGAALFVVVYIYLTNGNNYYSLPVFTIFTMPLIALAGGLAAAALIYALAWHQGMKARRLLLMGIAVNAGFNALIVIMQLSFDNRDFNRVLSWTSGSIWGVSWSYVIAAAPPLVFICAAALYQSRYLDVFTLGDETACGLGVNTEKHRRLLIIMATALAAVSTSVAGSIAFVGLLAPHIAGRLTGPQHRYCTPVSILTGMLLVTGSDIVARNLFAPLELHIGSVVSIIGAPYFIYLMVKQEKL
ncbi:MAG: iron ABC transporter permease [Spirochaetaceae bacterium]|jgi:iron complex transport system permease protein|nr:iron ABC transporter permease [Spirochaetaceae bacterium]